MFCARCSKPIREGEAYVSVDHLSLSGPGMTVHVHEERCQPIPQPAFPERRSGQ